MLQLAPPKLEAILTQILRRPCILCAKRRPLAHDALERDNCGASELALRRLVP